jgi:DNA modification methylase
MKHLLKHGYKAKLRPSGHNISTKFQRDNGGAVPPNLLAIANTESNGKYQSYCKERSLPQHPARFPAALPEYFIRLLTDEGDLVVDPLAGSCVTGEVCEALKRRWVCGELEAEYLEGAKGRFLNPQAPKKPVEPYSLYAPCLLPPEDGHRLPSHGGAERDLSASASKLLKHAPSPA